MRIVFYVVLVMAAALGFATAVGGLLLDRIDRSHKQAEREKQV